MANIWVYILHVFSIFDTIRRYSKDQAAWRVIICTDITNLPHYYIDLHNIHKVQYAKNSIFGIVDSIDRGKDALRMIALIMVYI